MTRLVYILGCGRSGSTFLNLLMGNHQDIEAVGELSYLTNNKWDSPLPCTCLGSTWLDKDPDPNKSRCAFWNVVHNVFTKSTPPDCLENYTQLQHKFERYRNFVHLLMNQISHSAEYTRYADITTTLFKSILEINQKPIIVDSSKNPMRAYALTMIPNLDLRIIHLVRDVRGVAWSRKKSFKKNTAGGIVENIASESFFKTSAEWIVTNLTSELVRFQLHPSKSLMVRYEDLISNPSEELKKIGDFAEVDLSPISDIISRGDVIEKGHSVAGNKLRMQTNIRMKPDTEWIHRLSSLEKRVFWLLSGWLMQRYGYTK